MSRYDVLSRDYDPLREYYPCDANGNELPRPPIDPNIKRLLDKIRKRESMQAMIEWTANER